MQTLANTAPGQPFLTTFAFVGYHTLQERPHNDALYGLKSCCDDLSICGHDHGSNPDNFIDEEDSLLYSRPSVGMSALIFLQKRGDLWDLIRALVWGITR